MYLLWILLLWKIIYPDRSDLFEKHTVCTDFSQQVVRLELPLGEGVER